MEEWTVPGTLVAQPLGSRDSRFQSGNPGSEQQQESVQGNPIFQNVTASDPAKPST